MASSTPPNEESSSDGMGAFQRALKKYLRELALPETPSPAQVLERISGKDRRGIQRILDGKHLPKWETAEALIDALSAIAQNKRSVRGEERDEPTPWWLPNEVREMERALKAAYKLEKATRDQAQSVSTTDRQPDDNSPTATQTANTAPNQGDVQPPAPEAADPPNAITPDEEHTPPPDLDRPTPPLPVVASARTPLRILAIVGCVLLLGLGSALLLWPQAIALVEPSPGALTAISTVANVYKECPSVLQFSKSVNADVFPSPFAHVCAYHLTKIERGVGQAEQTNCPSGDGPVVVDMVPTRQPSEVLIVVCDGIHTNALPAFYGASFWYGEPDPHAAACREMATYLEKITNRELPGFDRVQAPCSPCDKTPCKVSPRTALKTKEKPYRDQAT